MVDNESGPPDFAGPWRSQGGQGAQDQSLYQFAPGPSRAQAFLQSREPCQRPKTQLFHWGKKKTAGAPLHSSASCVSTGYSLGGQFQGNLDGNMATRKMHRNAGKTVKTQRRHWNVALVSEVLQGLPKGTSLKSLDGYCRPKEDVQVPSRFCSVFVNVRSSSSFEMIRKQPKHSLP